VATVAVAAAALERAAALRDLQLFSRLQQTIAAAIVARLPT
jgi:hypothetical protein